MLAEGPHAEDGAFTRGGTHQGAGERVDTACFTDVDRCVEIGYGEVPPLFADANEGTFGDECVSEGDVGGLGVDGAKKAGLGVDVGDEGARDVRGVVEDGQPEFGWEWIHTSRWWLCTFATPIWVSVLGASES